MSITGILFFIRNINQITIGWDETEILKSVIASLAAVMGSTEYQREEFDPNVVM
jgi:hypothetical protein